MERFFGREREMAILNRLSAKRSASLVVIKGRRRIGKSRLAEEFSKSFNTCYSFIGLPPEPGVTDQDQREEFASQLQLQLDIPLPRADDWSTLFRHLADGTKKGKILIIFDEINWMGDQDPTFLGKLKTSWDKDYKKNPQLIFILSGSMSSWIEKNILSSTGFLGRISLDMTLEELPLNSCNQFWQPRENRVSSYDKFKILSVVGGIPRYLEEIRPNASAEENIRALCFEKESLLFNEFNRIFSDLFSKRSSTYKKIIERLAEGSATLTEVGKEGLGIEKGGTISDYLEDLVTTGYVARDYTWNVSTGERSKISRFRLKDNYLRFYLKVIEPNQHKILQDEMNLPRGWESIMGLQFENLVLNNRKYIKQLLQLSSEHILFDNPYFQKKSKTHRGCQIDYMIQTQFNSLHLCEVKFSKEKIGTSVIEEVQDKIASLNVGKKFSIWPILIHVNGITDSVVESGYFSRIIDFGDLLKIP